MLGTYFQGKLDAKVKFYLNLSITSWRH